MPAEPPLPPVPAAGPPPVAVPLEPPEPAVPPAPLPAAPPEPDVHALGVSPKASAKVGATKRIFDTS